MMTTEEWNDKPCGETTTDISPEAVERFHASEFSGTMIPSPCGDWVRHSDYDVLSAALEAERERADEMGITAVEFSEMAAELVEEMSKRPNTSWGQVKAAIRALGDVGYRQAYNRTTARAEAAKAERDALKAELAVAVEVTEKLCKEASITSNRGAVTGSHWTFLGMAILKTRAFLARHKQETDT